MTQPTNDNAESARAMMDLAGGILVFAATVIGIVNDRLQRANSAKAKERVVSATFSIIETAFPFGGLLVSSVWGAQRLSVFLFVLGAVVVSLDYLRTTTPPSRLETFRLAVFLTAAAWFANQYLLGRVLGIIEQMTGSLDKFLR
jgi:hypothetical protein